MIVVFAAETTFSQLVRRACDSPHGPQGDAFEAEVMRISTEEYWTYYNAYRAEAQRKKLGLRSYGSALSHNTTAATEDTQLWTQLEELMFK